MLGFIELIFKLNQQTNQLQNHAKFITVHGIWAGGTPHNPRTRDHELWVVGDYGFSLINFIDKLNLKSTRISII